ncbi:MAG: DnaJ domain-containing protein [Kofleriaceae bacterium]|nr:DnaJ domain-containing protein [Kofleriaceae bacterium]
MSKAPLSVKLACQSWQQLSAIYSRDLCRNAFFLKTNNPPAIGTQVRISLVLPSDTSVELNGRISAHVAVNGLQGRGPGVDIALLTLSHSVMWLIESALSAAGMTPELSISDKGTRKPQKQVSTEKIEESGIDEGAEIIGAEVQLIDSLSKELASFAKWNAFQRLNIGYEANDDQVRSAFGELSKRYHPDRYARYQSPEIRELANELFILLRDAYRTLARAPERTAALAKIKPKSSPGSSPPLSPGSSPGSSPKLSVATAAPNLASTRKAKQIDTKVPDMGAEIFDSVQQSSVGPLPQANGTPISAQVELGFRVLESGEYQNALQILKIEVRKYPDDIHAQVGVELAAGKLALVSGDRMEAGQRFEAALDIDPTNERAAREIAEMRRHVTSQRRGLLSKLMKKI